VSEPAEDELAEAGRKRQDSALQVLRNVLRPSERVLVLAEACPRRFNMGVLSVTTQRVVYVQTRIMRSAVICSIPFPSIADVQVAEDALTGVLTITTLDRSYRFDLIRPKERTWKLLWRIRERMPIADQMPS
jgi:hypothetical protein